MSTWYDDARFPLERAQLVREGDWLVLGGIPKAPVVEVVDIAPHSRSYYVIQIGSWNHRHWEFARSPERNEPFWLLDRHSIKGWLVNRKKPEFSLKKMKPLPKRHRIK